MISTSTPMSPGAAEDFDDASGGRETTFGKADDFDVNDSAIEFSEARTTSRGPARSRQLFAQLGSQLVARRNQHFVLQARVVGEHVIAVGAVAEKSNDGRVFALDDLYHAALGATVGAAASDACQDAVAVHGVFE